VEHYPKALKTSSTSNENPISDVIFTDIDALSYYEFSDKFVAMIKNDFPDKGSYMGNEPNTGLAHENTERVYMRSQISVNNLILKADQFLKNGGFEYTFCGGFAIELFLNRSIRKHGDIDISVFWNDRNKIILYMQSLGWQVYEMYSGGIAHHITDIKNQIKAKRNIFCFKDGCELVRLIAQSDKDMYYLDFNHREQKELNFIEYLFNNNSVNSFLYARNEDISLPLSKAILSQSEIPYLAPELVLLYKSTETEREGYQLDYNSAMAEMNTEQKLWLQAALKTMNPSGHKWLE